MGTRLPWTKPSFYIVRHGETDRNDATPARYRGWDNVPLNEDGRQSADDLYGYLSYEQLGQITSSDLDRAVDTANALIPLSCVSYLDINPNFRPLDVGDFAGEPKTARNRKALQHFIDNPDELIPGGSETVNQFKARNSETFKQYAILSYSSPHPLVIVCHTSNCTCLCEEANATGLSPDDDDVIGAGGLLAVYVTPTGYEIEVLLKFC